MLSFHNDSSIKAKYLERVQGHAAADNIIQGTGWENGKGCAVGCTLENYDHDRYPVELGLPVWLAHLEDCIFEGLPKTKAKTWPERFLQAIPVGVDTDIVLHKLAIRRMNRLITLQQKALAKDNPDEIKSVINQAIAAIEMVKKCHEAEIGIWVCEVNFEAAEAASRSAARSAAWSAEAASRSAARSAAAAARSAAEAAAWSAARSAAWSAEAASRSAAEAASRSAAWSAPRSAAFEQEAEDLLELLAALKKE